MRLSSAALIVTINIGLASIAQAQGWSGTVSNVSPPANQFGVLQLAVQSNGDALAIWSGGRIEIARYIAATDSWEPPFELAGPGFFFSDVAIDGAGNAFIVLTRPPQNTFFPAEIHVVRYSPSSGSTNTTTLSSNAYVGTGEIVTDAVGNVMVAWSEPTGIHAARYDSASATWASPAKISSAGAFSLRLAVDGLNDVTAAWVLFQPTTSFLQVARFDSATLTWGGVTTLATPYDGPLAEESVDPPSLAADASGNVAVVWQQFVVSQGVVIRASRFVKAAGTWSTATSLSSPTGTALLPKVASDPAGNLIAVWLRFGGFATAQAARFDAASESWGSAIELGIVHSLSSPFDVQMDSAGNGLAIIRRRRTDQDVRIEASRFAAASNQWSVPVELSPAGRAADYPKIGFDAAGNATALWLQRLDGGLAAIQSTRWIEQPPAAPSDLVVSSVTGNVVTLAWKKGAGSTPTGYLIEGGITPGSVLGSLRTESPATTFTFTAPSGMFFIRLHALLNNFRSAASNEIQLVVDAAVVPSAPANVLGMVNGSSAALSWTNTFSGGAPTAVQLNVAGTQTGSFPVGMVETVSVGGVPGGTYTFTLTASNAAGVSPPSTAVTLTIPGGCSGPPGVPTYFAVSRSGRSLTLTWNPPVSGAAVTSYAIHASGAIDASVPTATRSLTGSVGPGTYSLNVVAVNECGTSAPSNVITVIVP
jgi:hypothetical protein